MDWLWFFAGGYIVPAAVFALDAWRILRDGGDGPYAEDPLTDGLSALMAGLAWPIMFAHRARRR